MYTALAPAYEEAYKIPYHRLSVICSAKRVKGNSFCMEGSWKTRIPTPQGASTKQTGMQKINDAVSLQQKRQHPTPWLPDDDSTARLRGLPGASWPHTTWE